MTPDPSAPEIPPLPADIGSLFNGLLGSALKKVLEDSGWPGHPLREVLDAAEASFPPEGHVSAHDMRDSLTLALKAHGSVPVRVLGEHDAPAATAGEEPKTLLIAVGDRDDQATALHRLVKALPPADQEPSTVRDVVLWVRRWESAPWAQREKPPFVGRAVWLKVWDANGALIGPLMSPPAARPVA